MQRLQRIVSQCDNLKQSLKRQRCRTAENKEQSEKIAFKMYLNPGKMKEYKERHDKVCCNFLDFSMCGFVPSVVLSQFHFFERVLQRQTNKNNKNYERTKIETEWPELSQELKNAGIFDYSIYFDNETNILFAVLRRYNNHSMDKLPEKQIMQKWWNFMSDIMKCEINSVVPMTKDLQCVFHMD